MYSSSNESSTIAGADSNIRTAISGIGVYYPDGTDTRRIGIVPDIELKPSVTGIRKGRDEVLEKAVELINR